MKNVRISILIATHVALATLSPAVASALTVYPVDRAEILAGSRFDLKVEFDGVIAEGDARVTVNGKDHAALLGRAAQFSVREAQVAASALILRGVTLDRPGTYTVAATDGKITRTVTWEVYGTGPRKARNAILPVPSSCLPPLAGDVGLNPWRHARAATSTL